MTRIRKILTIGAAALAISAMSLTAFAANGFNSPAEIVAGLTGKTTEIITAEKVETGKTYGQIADEAGKLEEFNSEMLELKKAQLAELVKAGKMTQAQAEEILATMEENMKNCDGTDSARIGRGMGAGFGRMNGAGRGMGAGCGQGSGRGLCRGK